jgi:hypothetical protein
MLRHFHQLVIPASISIAFFDATFLVFARLFSFNGTEVLMGVAAGAGGGLYVLGAILWQAQRAEPQSVV